MPEAAIQVLDVVKKYGGRTVLDQIRLDVFKGETLVILGGSGSGQSTLLRMMIGNVQADGGDIAPLRKSIAKMSDALLAASRKNICALFQSGALFNFMSASVNVSLP